jgi:hypothetical protein
MASYKNVATASFGLNGGYESMATYDDVAMASFRLNEGI